MSGFETSPFPVLLRRRHIFAGTIVYSYVCSVRELKRVGAGDQRGAVRIRRITGSAVDADAVYIAVIRHRDHLLRHQDLPANGAVTSLGQTGFGAGGIHMRVNNDRMHSIKIAYLIHCLR